MNNGQAATAYRHMISSARSIESDGRTVAIVSVAISPIGVSWSPSRARALHDNVTIGHDADDFPVIGDQ